LTENVYNFFIQSDNSIFIVFAIFSIFILISGEFWKGKKILQVNGHFLLICTCLVHPGFQKFFRVNEAVLSLDIAKSRTLNTEIVSSRLEVADIYSTTLAPLKLIEVYSPRTSLSRLPTFFAGEVRPYLEIASQCNNFQTKITTGLACIVMLDSRFKFSSVTTSFLNDCAMFLTTGPQ
jgi:hypothetical protein